LTIVQTDLPNELVGGDIKTILLEDLFTNTSPNNYCPVFLYRLVSGDGSLLDMDPTLRPNIWLNDTHLHVFEYTPIATIAVLAETFNKQRGWKVINITLDLCNTQNISTVNDPYNVLI